MRVILKLGGIGDEDKGSIFIDHANEAGTARPSIEPEKEGVIIRVSLGVEENVVESPSVISVCKVEIACMEEEVPEYHL